MTLGSFTLDGKRIDVAPDWSDIDGRIYRFIEADSKRQVAVTTYQGLRLSEGVPFDKAGLQKGLRGVLRRSIRV